MQMTPRGQAMAWVAGRRQICENARLARPAPSAVRVFRIRLFQGLSGFWIQVPAPCLRLTY